MNKFRNIVNKYIKDSKKRKRYLAFLLSLSMLVMFFVPLGLMENADSMTAGSPGGAILARQLKYSDYDSSQTVSNAIDLSNCREFKVSVTNAAGDSIGNEIDLSNGSVELGFGVNYTVDNVNNFNDASKAHFYFPISIVDTDNKAYDVTFDRPKDNMEEYTVIDTNYKNAIAGHYYIQNGYTYVVLTQDYISYLNNESNGTAVGALEFAGELSANADAGEKGSIKVGNEEIKVDFKLPEKTLSGLTKSNGTVSSDGKDVTWTITLENNQGLDLKDYTMVDEMFAKASNLIIEPSGAGAWNNGSDTITFNSTTEKSITVSYTTPVENIAYSGDRFNEYVGNTVSVRDNKNEEKKSASSSVNITKPTITKQGTANYDTQKIDWTITVNNTAKIDLSGYTIEDDNFVGATIVVKDASDKTVDAGTSGTTLTFPSNMSSYTYPLTITYSTNANFSEKNQYDQWIHKNSNTATLKKNNITIDTKTDNPPYKNEGDMYSLTKSGSYNPDTGLITWTVTVEAEEDMTLDGYKLKDEAFRGKSLNDFKFTYIGSKYTDWSYNGAESYIDFNDNVMSFKAKGNDTPTKVAFTYTTKATPQNDDTESENSIELDNPKDTPVVSKTVKVKVDGIRNKFTKTVANATETFTANSAKEVTSHWTVVLISDNGFAGKSFDDTFSVPDGCSSEIKNVKLYTKKTENDNKKEITDKSNITINGADITFGENFNVDEHYIVLEYDTVVTLPAVTDDSQYTDGKITYNITNSGSGSFGVGPGEVGVTITRQNPNSNNTKYYVQKSWNNKLDSISKVYVYVTARGNDGKTYYVAGTEGNYKLVETADYSVASSSGNGILFELNQNKTFESLPSSREINGTVVTYDNYTVHEYSINDTTTASNQFGDKTYIKLGDGSIIVKSENGNMITNTYYTTKDITLNKNWAGDTGSGNDVKSITVQIQSGENGGNWTNYKEIEITSWSNASLGNFPTAEIVNGNLVTYQYRVSEIKITTKDGKTLTREGSGNNVTFVDEKGNYYQTDDSVNEQNGTVEITNTYHKADNITITASKKWVDSSNNYKEYSSLAELRAANSKVETSLQSITLRLERSLQGGTTDVWEAVAGSEKTISANDSSSVSWSDLEVQKVVDGKLVKYKYRVVECGFTTTDGKNVTLSGSVLAPNLDGGYYQIDNSSSLDKSGTAIVKNTYYPSPETSASPQKNWSYDTGDEKEYSKSEKRADSVTLVLQQKTDSESVWHDYNVNGEPVKVTFTKSGNNNDSDDGKATVEWKTYTVSPSGVELSKLPAKHLDTIENSNNTITYEHENYKYRFVEESVTVNETTYPLNYGDAGMYALSVTGETEQIKAIDGKYVSTISGSAVDNRFKPNKGIDKYAVDSHANKIESIDSTDLEQYLYTLSDGNQYYVFNYVIEFTKNEMRPLVDKLPEGFSLVEEVKSTTETGQFATYDNIKKLSFEAGMNPDDTYWTNGYVNGSSNHPIAKGYYAAPMMYIIAPFVAPPEANGYLNKAEWGAYFGGWQNETTRNTNTSNIFAGILDDGDAKPTGLYVYDEVTRTLTLGSVNRSNKQASVGVSYSIKIEKDKLEEKIANGTFSIVNEAKKYDGNGNYLNTKDENTLVIKKPDNLISKDFAETRIPGQVKYTIDVNPDAKTLSNGSTVRITDVFDTISYTIDRMDCKSHRNQVHNPTTTNGSNLIDVLLNSLNVYAYDANGNKTKLQSNQYNFVFKNGADAKEGTATLELNVPDSTHISIEYTYKLIANENTPSVKQGCKSTSMQGGIYPVMESGMTPPAGDKISMKNKARLETESNVAEKEKIVNNFEIAKSYGSISTTILPKIQKVNIADYNVNNLKANFVLAYYGEDSNDGKGWVYAKNIESKNVTWYEDASKTVPEDAFEIQLDGTSAYEVNLQDGVIYKLIETKVPDGYEGSNLGLSADDYKKLILKYVNTGDTEYNNVDYADFLDNFVFEHYFLYNAIPSSASVLKPDGFDTANVMQVQTGVTVDVPNNELIDIKVTKDWVNFDEENLSESDTKIILQLLWSDTNSSKIPDNAKPVLASELGIMDNDFSSVAVVPYSTKAETVWRNLPNGHGNTPIYYYVKEIGYTIDDELYMLDETIDAETSKTVSAYRQAEIYEVVKDEETDKETGKVEVTFKEDASEIGKYFPTYVNNAVNKNDENVEITNSTTLRLHKVWTDAENKVLPANSTKIGTEKIEVEIFGIESNGAQSQSLFGKIELDRENWFADITAEQLEEVDLSKYVSFTAKETGLPAGTNFVTSVTFKINNNTGEITVTNKNPNAVSASVSVNKVWSDGNDIHSSDSIEVTLYQVDNSKELSDSPTEEELKKAGAVVYQPEESYNNPVTLNAENDWANVWSGLPLDNADETTDGNSTKEYAYYVVETAVNIAADSDKYTANVTRVQTGSNYAYTIANERPSITVKKEWYNENDILIDAPVDSIQVRLYKEGESAPKTGLKVICFGDSITDGYGSSESNCSKNGKDYPSKLINLLTSNNYTITNGSPVWNFNKGESGQQIGNENDGFRKRVSTDIPADTDIICFIGGTNDIHQSGSSVKGDAKGVYDRFEACIGEIQTQAPNAVIFVGSIPHFDFYKDGISGVTEAGQWWNWLSNYSDNDGAIPNGIIDDYNAKIKSYADGNTTDNVYYVDICSVVTDNYIRNDGCHPNEDGYTAIANAYYNAIEKYYTPKSYLKADGTFTDNADEAATYEITGNGDWTKVIDLPSGFDTDVKLSVEEVENENLADWEVSYSNNSQTALSPEAVVVKNKYNPPTTEIEITKTWKNDDAEKDADLRAKLDFTIYRSTDNKAWEEVLADLDGDIVKNGDTWTLKYANLPAKSPDGKPYSYTIEETPINGYTCTIGEPKEKDGKITFAVTNTRSVSITVKKDWNDDVNHSTNNSGVKVKIWRSTTAPNKDDLPLTLKVSPSGPITMGANDDYKLTTNRTDATFESSNEAVATVDANGNIHSLEAGKAEITVKAGNENITIDVNVVAISLVVPETMTAGQTDKATIDPKGNTITDISYSSSNTDIISIDSNGNITAHDVGTATITATCKVNGVPLTVSKTINVGYNKDDTLTITGDGDEIEAGGEPLQLRVSPSYGEITWTSSDETKAKVDQRGLVTGLDLTADNEVVTITATRKDGKSATYAVKVVENANFVLYLVNGNSRTNVTDKAQTNADAFEVPLNSSLSFESNKNINIESNDTYSLIVNKTGDKTFTISKGNAGTTEQAYVGFKVTYGNNEKKSYHVHVVELPSVTVSASQSTVVIGDTAQTVQITADPSDATITYDSLPSGVTYENGTLTVEPNAETGKVTFTATKDGYNEGTCTVNISDGSAPAGITGTISANAGYMYFNDEHTAVRIESIVIENMNVTDTYYINIGNDGFTLNSNSVSVWNGTFKATLDGNTLTLTNFTRTYDKINFNAMNAGNYTIVLKDGASGASLAPLSLTMDSVSYLLAEEPTWIKEDGKEYYSVDVKYSEGWEKTITDLPVSDSSGSAYYYWIEEVPVSGYEATYDYDGTFDEYYITNTGGTITVRNTPTSTYDEGVKMPSTGGSGTVPYTVVGMIITGGALITAVFSRRKRKNA
ncbi:MAG: GDSL-type esterase/lipase family protein [Ruminococcus flavefaciens]|nr:GDSL-type esterase/lipase family protein [Ruminococcus flavefaciens]